MTSYSYQFPRPALSVDVVVLHGEATRRSILLVRRAAEPFRGLWALPGGFVDEYEPPESAARRELAEETGIVLPAAAGLEIVGARGERGRDPRGWTVSVVYRVDLGASGQAPPAVGGDDAAEAGWWRLASLPALAFDHSTIIAEAVEVPR